MNRRHVFFHFVATLMGTCRALGGKHFLRLALLALLPILFTACRKSGKMSSAQLIYVKDGDSIVVSLKGRETEVRLYGIDAPEFGQAYGEKSTKALRKLLADHEVGIEPVTTDRHERTVAIVFADGKNVCEAMVADGQAWVYTKYCTKSFCGKWQKDEENARKARLGLWKKDSPRPPWEWRKTHRWQQLLTPPGETEEPYSGNVKSGAFHRSGCKGYHCKNCTRFFTDRKQAMEVGFRPCGRCQP